MWTLFAFNPSPIKIKLHLRAAFEERKKKKENKRQILYSFFFGLAIFLWDFPIGRESVGECLCVWAFMTPPYMSIIFMLFINMRLAFTTNPPRGETDRKALRWDGGSQINFWKGENDISENVIIKSNANWRSWRRGKWNCNEHIVNLMSFHPLNPPIWPRSRRIYIRIYTYERRAPMSVAGARTPGWHLPLKC